MRIRIAINKCRVVPYEQIAVKIDDFSQTSIFTDASTLNRKEIIILLGNLMVKSGSSIPQTAHMHNTDQAGK